MLLHKNEKFIHIEVEIFSLFFNANIKDQIKRFYFKLHLLYQDCKTNI